jgi:capsular exopolysaccharide synthesis family protein
MEQSPLELRDHLALLWRQRWIVLAVGSAALAGALLYSFIKTPVYTSSSEVVVRAAQIDTTVTPPFVNMQTEEEVANSANVALLAQREMGSGAKSAAVSAELVPDSETLKFTAVAPEPTTAQAAAQAYAEAYLELRRREVLSDLQVAREPREARIQLISQELTEIEEQLAVTDDEADRVLLNARWAELLSERTLVNQELSRLATPESVQVGEVIQAARLPRSPSSPKPLRNGLLGIMIGLSLGVGFAYLRDRLDQRMWGEEELEARSGAPVLAGLPVGTPLHNDLPVVASDPASELAEAYNALRLRILRVADERGARVLVVTSSLAQEGKTSVVANLGAAMAESGKRVAVVSGDLRRPGLQTFFPIRRKTGLTQLLTSNRRLNSALTGTRVKNLFIVHAGALSDSSSPLELLSSLKMRDAVTELRRTVDLVLIDTPPLLAAHDAAAVAAFADGVLFVADARLATRTTVEQARRELELSGTPLLGVVINRYERQGFRPYSYHYEYTDGKSAQQRRGLGTGPERTEATREATSAGNPVASSPAERQEPRPSFDDG